MGINKGILIICLLLFANVTMAQKNDFHNRALSDDARIENLLSQLTLDEKISLLSTDLGVPRLGIPSGTHYEGLHGLTLGGPGAWGGTVKDECGKKTNTDFFTTIFPQSYGLASTWDVNAIKHVGEQTALEARYYMQHKGDCKRHALVMRAPNADLARDPRWGRTEESYGEDAFLTSRLTVAMIKALQGDDPHYWKTASLMKHFLANSNEEGRGGSSSDFDERLFREYYSYPFYKGITEGGSRAFMASYNSWNGTPMCINPILEKITRNEWGNNGIICTDGGALKLLIDEHKAFPTLTEGAAAVVKATTGQFLDTYDPYIREALKNGMLTEKDIDKAIRGNLFVALKLGLLDGKNSKCPYRFIGMSSSETPPYENDDVKKMVRDITAESVVLLKNDKSASTNEPLLPINTQKVKKIALIGPYADKIVQDWYSGTPSYEVTILKGLKAEVGDDVEIEYFANDAMSKAEEAAAKADMAIVCVGNHPFGTRADWFFCPVPSDGREAVDRKSLMLPDEDLVKLITKANPNTLLVLVSSFPYTINWSQEHVPAIVQITHCSQEQGSGLADVLLGKVSPAGRTVQTWVNDITELPDMMDYDIRHGRTYMYHKGKVLYPFGFGLSYTHFNYRRISSLSQNKKEIKVKVEIENDGSYDGDEVVQLYVSFPDSKVERPIKELRAFTRLPFKKGEKREVELVIDKNDLRYWDIANQKYVLEKGTIELQIGASSEDIRLKKSIKISNG